jgi:hypothetical protein
MEFEFELYHKRKKLLEEKYGKLINVRPYNDETFNNKIASDKQQKYVKEIQDISDQEGLKRAYEAKDGLYQHYNKLFIAGTKDWPGDAIDDLKLPFDDTLNKTKRGRDADKYYRSHHEIDTVIGHSLGGAVALSLEKQYKKQDGNPYGIVQSKTFGAPTVSGNISNPLFKNIVKDEIVGAGVAGMGYIGASADSAIGFADGGLLSGLGADIGKKISTDFANRITSDTNTSPDRIRYFGDPVSMFDNNAKTVMPSFGFRWKNSAHSYKGLFIKDAIPLHDIPKNPLTPSGNDEDAQIITE